MSLVVVWEQDTKHCADEARVRHILKPKDGEARAQVRQRERKVRQSQTNEEQRGADSVFQTGLSIYLVGTLILFVCSLVWR